MVLRRSSRVTLNGLLNIDKNDLTPSARYILDRDKAPEDLQKLLDELTSGIAALSQFQDILSVSLHTEDGDIVNRHYAYYESLVYLRESVGSWLDRNVLSALTTLRPFLELSVLHLYWYLRCESTTYRPYYVWLRKGKGKPTFGKARRFLFESMPAKEHVSQERLRELEEVIANIYKELCLYNHTPRMDESITAKARGMGTVALESFYYYLHIANILLRQVVFLYILAYPMCLFPVDKHQKWGFSGPVGLFFDKMNYVRLESYIGEESIAALTEGLVSLPNVQSLREWFDSLPDMSAPEIEADWTELTEDNPEFNKTEAQDLHSRLSLVKSQSRALGWALNYVVEHTQDQGLTDEVVRTLRKRIREW